MRGLQKDLTALVDSDSVKTDPEDMFAYQSDATHYFAKGKPDAVVLPSSTQEVSAVLSYANKNVIPVTPRGAGSGLSGGCTPIKGGIVLDMKRMNTIREINRGNMTATVDAGVVLADFHQTVESQGLFYPPDPQSMTVCTIGGNVATRAGGPRGVKYGTTPHYVLGVEAVLPDGYVIQAGGKCVKQSVGYDLTHLLTGSEGTLGVITQANLRIMPLPPFHRTALVTCKTIENAAEMIAEIIAAGTVPAMLELLMGISVHVMNSMISPPAPTDGEAYLLMDIDGSEGQVREDAETLNTICKDMGAVEVRVIEDEKEAQTYWKARASLYPLALTMAKKVVAEDVTVPRDKVPTFVREVQAMAARLGLLIGLSGHAGDGNMHPSILYGEVNEKQEKLARKAIAQIVKTGLALGGTISGEHGIGLHKSEFLEWDLGGAQIELMKRVKKAFDPNGIMNPGKLWLQGGE